MKQRTFERPLAETSGESEPHPNLALLTFTGIDRLTAVDEVFALHERYPKTEFGILAGWQPNGLGQEPPNRFMDRSLVEAWRDLAQEHGLPLAIHLCGHLSKDVMAGDFDGLILPLCAGFSRVQINSRSYDYGQVAQFAEAVDCPQVILQRRGPLSPQQGLVHPKVEYLLDNSGGQGREGFDAWDPPSAGLDRHGYSGGLSPENIGRGLEFVDRFRGQKFWLDMESGVRSNDWLDLDKVESVCQQAFAG